MSYYTMWVCTTCGYKTDDDETLDWENNEDYYCPICGDDSIVME